MTLEVTSCVVDLSTSTEEELLKLHTTLLQTKQRYWSSKQTVLDKTNQTCLYINMANCWGLGYYRTNISCADFIELLLNTPKEDLKELTKGIPITFG